MQSSQSIHANCVAINDKGVLILGGPGSGKSSLTLDLLGRGARLISDDLVLLEARSGRLIAQAPARSGGQIEIRGIGIGRLDVSHLQGECSLHLAIDLDHPPKSRLPHMIFYEYQGVSIPKLQVKGVTSIGDYLYLLLNDLLTHDAE